MTQQAEVIVIWSVSYTGGTWISLVAGSHPDIVYVGNPRICFERLMRDTSGACQIHGNACDFWPAFKWNHGDGLDFVRKLARYSGRRAVILRNPDFAYFGQLTAAPDIKVTEIVIVRDLRSLAASYMRKNRCSVVGAIDAWLLTGARNMERHLQRASAVRIHYERCVQDGRYLLARLSEIPGLAYDETHLRYWEHDLHPVNGNASTMAVVKAYQTNVDFEGDSIYAEFLARLRSGSANPLVDERWRGQLTEFDRFVIDESVGSINAKAGYERDMWPEDRRNRLKAELDRILDSEWSRGQLARVLAGRRGEPDRQGNGESRS